MKKLVLFLVTAIMLGAWAKPIKAQTAESDTVWCKTFPQGIYPYFAKFSPTNDSIVLMAGRAIQLRDAKTGDLIREYPPVFPDDKRVFTFDYSPDGKYVCYGGEAKYVILLNLQTGNNTIITAVDSFTNGWVQSLSFSPDSKTLALSTGNYNMGKYIGQKFEFWYVETGIMKYSHQTSENLQPLKYTNDGKYIISTYSDKTSSKLNVYSSDSCKYLFYINDDNNQLVTFSISQDNSFAASCSDDGYIKIWDLNTKKIRKSIYTKQGMTIIDISTDGKYCAVGAGGEGKTEIWDIESGQLVYKYNDISGSMFGLNISKDQKYILSCNAGLILYRFQTKNDVVDLPLNVDNIVVPNPTSGLLRISLTNNQSNIVKIQLFNTLGNKLYDAEQATLNGFCEIQTNTYPNGTYYCTIESGNTVKTYKIIINK